jgi:hypothetical protein
MSGPTGVIARRVVAIAAQQVAKQVPQQVLTPLLVPPAVFFASQRWALLPTREASGKQKQEQHQQLQAAAAPAVVRRRSRFRRFKAVAAAAARILPWGAAKGAAAVFSAATQLTSLAASVPVSGAAVGGLAVGIAAKGVRRWQVARRSARRGMVAVKAGPAAEVSVVTFNIRGIMDRWPERSPLLRRCLKQADADVFCFQEVLTGALGFAGEAAVVSWLQLGLLAQCPASIADAGVQLCLAVSKGAVRHSPSCFHTSSCSISNAASQPQLQHTLAPPKTSIASCSAMYVSKRLLAPHSFCNAMHVSCRRVRTGAAAAGPRLPRA